MSLRKFLPQVLSGGLLSLATAMIGLSGAAAAETVTSVTQISYDALFRVQCQATRMNPDAFGSLPASACNLGTEGAAGPDRIKRTTYDPGGREVQIELAVGTSIAQVERTQTYTGNGKLKTVADANGNLTTYDYDGFDRLLKVSYPNVSGGGSSASDYEAYVYDASGNRISWRRRSGETVAFSYDALNRAANGLRGETYAYDLLGHRISASYAGGTAGATFDALGRMTSETTASLTLTYAYDGAGRRSRITWPDGFYVTYEYDAADMMVAIREQGAAELVHFNYDALGRRSTVTRLNGVTTSYTYDTAARLKTFGHDLAGSYFDQTWSFTYNAARQVAGREASSSVYEWTAAQPTKAYTVNGLNQYATVGGVDTRYDARGNLWCDSFATASSQCAGTSYGYDLLNNITSTSTGAVLAYEPSGRLWQVSLGGATANFLYSGPNLVGEYNGGLLRRYVPGPGADEPMVWYEGGDASNRRWLLTNAQGSIVAATDVSGGALYINRYDEYGLPAASNQGRFQYTGQAWISELGLYHYKARAYSPTLGRFMQTDPEGFVDGLNLYDYVGGDPMNRVDPTGTQYAGPSNSSHPTCGFICHLFGGAVPIKTPTGTTVGTYNYGAATTGTTIAAATGAVYQGVEAAVELSPLVVYGVAKSPGIWARIAGLFERGAERGIKTPTGIATPYGVAQQAGDAASLAARSQVEAGASLYRFGTTGRSQTAEAQFWALEHPLSAGYGNRYGIPAENIANANFIEMGQLPLGTPFVTRPAPAVGGNLGGGIEVVTPPNSVDMNWFSSVP